MPPVVNVTCLPSNSTTDAVSDIGKDDLNALLYIVVTLLFYSMGIIIGIITYLKREQAEMEEDKLFDMYMQLRREPFNLQKKEQVQQTALYLKQLEEHQAAREKIENWRITDVKQPHLQQHHSCRRHTQQHSLCPDCKKPSPIQEIPNSDTDDSTLARSGNECPESIGGTAILCSLTLGMCEPLLNADTSKRDLTPCSSVIGSKFFPTSTRCLSVPRTGQTQASKNAFKHISFADNDFAVSKQGISDQAFSNEPQVPFSGVISQGVVDDCVTSMFDQGDIELTELHLFKDEIYFDFQKISPAQGKNPDVIQRSSEIQSISSSLKPSLSLVTIPLLTKEPGVKLIGGESLHQVVCAPFEETSYFSSVRNTQESFSSKGTKAPDETLKKSSQLKAVTVRQEAAGVDNIICCNKTHENVFNDLVQGQQRVDQNNGEGVHHPQEHEPVGLPVYTASPLSSVQPLQDRYPLHHQNVQTQRHHMRPRSCPARTACTFLVEDDAFNMYVNLPDRSLSQSKQNTENQPNCSWKASSSQNLHILDTRKAENLQLELQNKTSDKKSTTGTQPERRDALLYTQTALQRDPDSSKSASSLTQSKLIVIFDRQDSIDSHNSQT